MTGLQDRDDGSGSDVRGEHDREIAGRSIDDEWFGADEPERFTEEIRTHLAHTRTASDLLDAPAFMVVFQGPEHEIINANPTYYRLGGQRRLLGRTVREAYPELADSNHVKQLDETYRTGEQCVVSRETLRVDRSRSRESGPVHVSCTYQPLIEEDGSTWGILVHGIDLTEWWETERRLSTLAEHLPGVLYRCQNDRDWTMEYMSSGTRQLTGWSPDELVGEDGPSFADLIHREDRENVWSSVQQAIQEGHPFQLLYRIETRDGEQRWVWEQGQVLDTAGSGNAPLMGCILDVTDWRRSREEVRASRRLIETTFQSLQDAVFVVNHPEREITACNPAAERMFGWAEEELVGSSTKRLHVDEEHYRQFGQESQQALVEEGTYRGEHRMRRSDGTTFFTEHVVSFVGSSDDPDRAVSVIRDITERKEMEQSLRKREELYRTLFEGAREGFLIQSFDDTVLAANRAAGDLLGYTPDELNGMHLEEITAQEMKERCGEKHILEYQLDRYEQSIYNWSYQHKDGSTVPVETSLTRIEYDDTDAVLASLRDRTEIEHLRKKDQRKSSFVSQVTHDLRTPLNSITGMATLLMDTDLTGQQQNYLQTILNASRNMERLTNDILDLNRIERGELILDEEPFHVQRLLGEVISLYSRDVEERDVTLSTQVDDDVPDRFIGDPDRLKQILHNLVDNAIRHTREGSIHISVELQEQDESAVHLLFSVSDTGTGIPEAERDQIFEEHRQVQSTSGAGQGLGIGLTICRSFVELMNGDIDVESTVGEGTTFTFTVELQEATQNEPGSSVVLSEVDVLIAEDNAFMREVFCRYLEARDMDVHECECGKEALDELTNSDGSTYDVVFLDQRLGDVSGVDIVRRLEQTDEAVDPDQVFIVTGDPAERIEDRLEPVSCAGVLEKPVDESALINAVSSAVLTEGPVEEEVDVDELQSAIQQRAPENVSILVVDDDQNTRTLLNELLMPIADVLTFVTNGKEAVDQRLNDPPHIILMDLEMPEMDGLEATEVIREMETEKNLNRVPIITQTARAMKHVERTSLEAGANKFICKPIKRGRLYRAILDVLS